MHGSSDTVYYTTPIAVIGSHEWVLQVYQQAVHGSRCTRYRWRRCGELRWRPGREWPTYDINDGRYAGLPKRLGRHYGRHQAAIEKALGRVPPQAELFNAPNPFLSQQREDF